MKLAFTLSGRVADSVQLNYRTPAESVRALLPDGLELVTRGPWAFWNVLACQVERLRPTGWPRLCAMSYTHVAYRLRVQAMNDLAEVVQGLYDVRSDVDARAVSRLGNTLTDLQLHSAELTFEAHDCGVRCAAKTTQDTSGALELDLAHTPARLLADSCFPSIEDARQYFQQPARTLAVIERDGRRLLRVTHAEHQEQASSQTSLAIHYARLGYFESIGQDKHAQLEWASRLGPIDIHWRLGETVGLLQQPRLMKPAIHAVG